MAIKLPPKTANAAPAANSSKALIVIRDRIKSRNDKYQLETGRDLLDAKAIVPHGKFGSWVKENFGWSTSTVNNFMNAAKLVDELPKIGDLKPSAIMALAAPSTPETVKSEVLADLDAGKKPTVTEIKAKIASTKAPKLPAAKVAATVKAVVDQAIILDLIERLRVVGLEAAILVMEGAFPGVDLALTLGDNGEVA